MEKNVENEIENKSELSLSLQTRLYKKLFIGALSKMKSGCLKIVDPDGSFLLYGDKSKNYDAFNSAHIHVKVL